MSRAGRGPGWRQRRGQHGLDHVTARLAAPEEPGYGEADGDGVAFADVFDVALAAF